MSGHCPLTTEHVASTCFRIAELGPRSPRRIAVGRSVTDSAAQFSRGMLTLAFVAAAGISGRRVLPGPEATGAAALVGVQRARTAEAMRWNILNDRPSCRIPQFALAIDDDELRESWIARDMRMRQLKQLGDRDHAAWAPLLASSRPLGPQQASPQRAHA